MNVKQIFSCYDHNNSNRNEYTEFCSRCGNHLEAISEGGIERPFCANCGFILYRNPFPAVSVLITGNHCVLLGKRSDSSFLAGKWCLPCGYIEYNEDFLTAAAREVREETGLEVALDSIVNVTSNFLSEKIHSLVIVLLAHITGGELQPGDDITELGWFAPGHLPEMAFEADIQIIERYFSGEISCLKTDNRFNGA